MLKLAPPLAGAAFFSTPRCGLQVTPMLWELSVTEQIYQPLEVMAGQCRPARAGRRVARSITAWRRKRRR